MESNSCCVSAHCLEAVINIITSNYNLFLKKYDLTESSNYSSIKEGIGGNKFRIFL